ncbi:MAG: tyrosinase family protein [Acidobacteria bacterium]|nr:tyrosinase family protein [Acidobacteriota bacterium]
MHSKDREDSRREFIARIGFDAATLLVPVSFAGQAFGQACAPPGNTANPVAWTRDCRTIQARRPASTLTASEITKLKNAYKAMRDLAVSDPADPRGFTHQANIHCHNCGGGGSSIQVHGTLRFLPWHRAYLYFHERILGHLIGDTNFRLPFWDWENPAHRKMPGAYTNPNNATNPLFNGTRALGPADDLDPTSGQPATALAQTNFNDFSPELEGAPHGSVHVDVGGDMGAFNSAARDPIFYAHHSNVDKIWSDWMAADVTHTAPATAAWQNQTQGFFDENKTWRTIRNIDVVNHEPNLRYRYAGRSYDFISIRCFLRWDIVANVSLVNARIRIAPLARTTLRNTMEKSVTHLRIIDPKLPSDRSANYNVYYDERDAKENKGKGAGTYLGMLSVVLMDKESAHGASIPRQADFDLSPKLKALLDKTDDIDLYYVDRNDKQGSRVSKLPFRSVQMRVAKES